MLQLNISNISKLFNRYKNKNMLTSEPTRVEGIVIIKRKAFWVKRYAKVENQFFSYKKDKSKAFTPNLFQKARKVIGR